MNRRECLRSIGWACVPDLGGCAGAGQGGKPRDDAPAAETAPDPQAVAYCGVDCETCDIYKAPVHLDAEALERAHASWTQTAQEHWRMETRDPAILRCRGCRVEEEPLFKGCRQCRIRRCVRKRGLASCGQCADWRTCKRLGGLLADCPEAREPLERIAKAAGT